MARKKRKKKKIKIIERKLGRERCFGQTWQGDYLIEIDPRQTPKQYMDTLFHEYLHNLFPDKKEKQIKTLANKISNFFWEQNYRRVNQ